MPAGTPTGDEELEGAAGEFEDTEDDDEDETDDEADDDEELEGNGDGDAFANLETKLAKTVSKRITTYTANQEKRLVKYRERQHAWRQRRLDEYALKNVGTAAISNPEAVAASLERQVQAAEGRLAQLQAMRQKLAGLASGEQSAGADEVNG
jgi:hypothetical protein